MHNDNWTSTRYLNLKAHSQTNYTQDLFIIHTAKEILFSRTSSRTKLPFSRPKYTKYMQKWISYLFNIWSIIDICYDTASSSLLLRFWSTHFYLNFNQHGISRLCTGTLFLLQSKFSSTGIIFIHRLFCYK